MKVTHEALQKRHVSWKAIRFAWGRDVPFVMGVDWAAITFPDAFFQPAYQTPLALQLKIEPDTANPSAGAILE